MTTAGLQSSIRRALRAASWLFAALLLFQAESSATAAQRSAERIYSVDEVIREAPSLEGKAVLVRGDFVFESENYNLWSRAGRTRGVRGRCVQYSFLDALYNRREELNRTRVVMKGTLRNVCREDWCRHQCEAVGLEQPEIISTSPLYGEVREPIPGSDWSSVLRPSDDSDGTLRAYAARLKATLAAGVADKTKRAAITSFIHPEFRSLVVQELAKEGSRPNRLLFDAANSIGIAAKHDPAAPVVVRTLRGGSDYYTSICFCRGKRCNWPHLHPKHLWRRAAGQPEVCLPLQEGRPPWLHPRYILGMPYEEKPGA